MSDESEEMLAMPDRPGILASATKTVLLALVGPMERVGMNPQQWFAVVNSAARANSEGDR